MPTPEELAAAAATKAETDAAAAKKIADDKLVADKAAADKAAEDAAKEDDPQKAFEEYLATLEDDVRAEIEKHTTGLKSALVKERLANKDVKSKATRLKELEDAETKRQQATLTQAEKDAQARKEAETKSAKLEEDLRTERIKNAVLTSAADMKFVDPLDAYNLIDRVALKIDDAGKVTGVDEALKALIKAKPYLTGEPGKPNYDINGGSRGKGTGKQKLPDKQIIKF